MSEYEAFLAARAKLYETLGSPTLPAPGAGPTETLVEAGGDAIITPSGITVLNGAIVVKNAGATVIIDGTSNMFKIAATGTMNYPYTDAGTPNASATVTVATGLTYAPAFLGFVQSGSYAYPSPLDNGVGVMWEPIVRVVNTNETEVSHRVHNSSGSPVAAFAGRYYLLKEAAL